MPLGRDRARLFGREAERYDRARPSYPDALIDEVLEPNPQGRSVLDVACGTGIASRQMAARGARVLGLDLNPEMALVAQRYGITVEVGAFEAWDPAGRRFDVVTCAQAWHWLEPHASLEKAAAVLNAGGRLCLFWNVGRHPDALADALQAVYDRASLPASMGPVGYAARRAGRPAFDTGAVVQDVRACEAFAEPGVRSFSWSCHYTRDQWLDQLPSHSDHAALEPEVRDRLLDDVGRAIDAFGGSFLMAYDAILISATRNGVGADYSGAGS